MTLCKQCGLEIRWIWTWEPGKRRTIQCFDLDGKIHWDKCSATRFARIQRTGEKFDEGHTKGYYTPLKKSGVQYTQQTSGSIRGRNYHPSGACKQCCPPWGLCETCPDKLEPQNENTIR